MTRSIAYLLLFEQGTQFESKEEEEDGDKDDVDDYCSGGAAVQGPVLTTDSK